MKAREFWIIREPPYSTWVSNKPLYSADTDEEIHVIEYSAYQALEARHKKLLEALKLIEITTPHTIKAMQYCAFKAIESDEKARWE